ncbi:uncharacterized protein BDZ99DRAFT_559216 [Mytilinidion resinicola]|uniref:Uncharacterized protein n=1 Tax=Mytilinidion resinicola TaxID=574789 RepID=A0A6A6YTF9_9PEZI|nr:uncharacterized protein BDZ99DRAFT_559216 [Mytilinidion resinicola]KAF2811314.1 hypothetical protein BDZ99DRAFT_559216 [Mytilinidion resinicola]
MLDVKIFNGDNDLLDHLQTPEVCRRYDNPQLEGFTREQEAMLKSKKKSSAETEEQKWKAGYKILFPQDQDDDIPSPYYDYNSPTERLPDEANFAKYQEYLNRELPSYVRKRLHDTLDQDLGPMEEILKLQLVDIVRSCQKELFSSYQQSCQDDPVVNSTRRSIVLSESSLSNELRPLFDQQHISSESAKPIGSTTAAPTIAYSDSAYGSLLLKGSSSVYEGLQVAMKERAPLKGYFELRSEKKGKYVGWQTENADSPPAWSACSPSWDISGDTFTTEPCQSTNRPLNSVETDMNLRFLNDFPDPQPEFRDGTGEYLDIRFQFNRRLDESDIMKSTERLRKLIVDPDLPVRHISLKKKSSLVGDVVLHWRKPVANRRALSGQKMRHTSVSSPVAEMENEATPKSRLYHSSTIRSSNLVSESDHVGLLPVSGARPCSVRKEIPDESDDKMFEEDRTISQESILKLLQVIKHTEGPYLQPDLAVNGVTARTRAQTTARMTTLLETLQGRRTHANNKTPTNRQAGNTTSESPTSQKASNSKKRTHSDRESEHPNDNDDDESPRKRPKFGSEVPDRSSTLASGRGAGFENVSRVKLQAHSRQDPACEVRELHVTQVEGFTKKQEKELEKKTCLSGPAAELDKWIVVYRILFPDVPREDIPNPRKSYPLLRFTTINKSVSILAAPSDHGGAYSRIRYLEITKLTHYQIMTYQLCNDMISSLSPASDKFEKFEEFSEREFSRLFRAQLEATVHPEIQDLREAMGQLFTAYQRLPPTTSASTERTITNTRGQRTQPRESPVDSINDSSSRRFMPPPPASRYLPESTLPCPFQANTTRNTPTSGTASTEASTPGYNYVAPNSSIIQASPRANATNEEASIHTENTVTLENASKNCGDREPDPNQSQLDPRDPIHTSIYNDQINGQRLSPSDMSPLPSSFDLANTFKEAQVGTEPSQNSNDAHSLDQQLFHLEPFNDTTPFADLLSGPSLDWESFLRNEHGTLVSPPPVDLYGLEGSDNRNGQSGSHPR